MTVNSRDSKGSTPLHKAALHGHRQIVQALLLHGAGMNVRNKDELLTPLHLACQYNQRDVRCVCGDTLFQCLFCL